MVPVVFFFCCEGGRSLCGVWGGGGKAIGFGEEMLPK